MGPNHSNFTGYYGAPKRQINKKLIFLIAGIVVLLFIVIFVISAVLGKDNIGTQSQHLSVRLGNLTTLTSAAAKELGSGDLKKLNAETSIITDGVQSDLAATLPKKIDKSIEADEADTTATTTLQNAALAGTYDASYKQVLQQKLESIMALLTEMYSKTKSPSLRTTLSSDYNNYQAILTNLNKIKS